MFYAGNDSLFSFYTLRMKAFLEFFISLKTNAGKESLNMIFSFLFVGNIYTFLMLSSTLFLSRADHLHVFCFLMTNETTK